MSTFTDPHGNALTLPCSGAGEVFGVLIDGRRGTALAYAIPAARAICGGCDLRAQCHADPENAEWVALMNNPKRRRRKPGEATQRDNFNQARLEDLRELAAQELPIYVVTKRLGVSRDSLYQWCRRHGHLDLWRQLNPPVEDVLPRPNRAKRSAA